MEFSEVKTGIVRLTTRLEGLRNKLRQARENVTSTEVDLGNLATEFGDLKTEVESYTPTGAAETVIVDDFSQLLAQGVALRTGAIAAKADLAKRTEF